MRRTIAARLSEAKQDHPALLPPPRRPARRAARLRSELNRQLERGREAVGQRLHHQGLALALQQVPDCNAVWAGDEILRLKPSDIAVAVAIEGGLFTPVLRDAERKTLSALSER